MRLMKCDICGKTIEDHEPGAVGYVSMCSNNRETGEFHNETFDLCPECTKDLHDHLTVRRDTRKAAK